MTGSFFVVLRCGGAIPFTAVFDTVVLLPLDHVRGL